MKKALVWVVVVAAIMALTACASTPAPAPTASPAASAQPTVSTAPSATASASVEATTAPAKKPVKIAYISKMLTNPWFVSQDQGLKDKANDLGVQYFSIDANLSDEACDAAIDNALAQGINGLAICITNQGNGPALAMKCREKGVELITCDDNIVDENGQPVAHVGMPTKDVGVVGGEMLAKYANDRNFFAPGNVVKVLQIDAPSVSVLKPRLDGYQEALMANTSLKKEDFIYVETKACMLEDSLAAAQATIAAHPEVTHWICGGVNDDSAVAFVKAIEEQGKIPLKNILACGLGGYSLAVDEFKKNNDSFMTVVLDPYREGQIAMQTLFDKIVNGTPMPQVTYVNGKVATVDNWKDLIKQ